MSTVTIRDLDRRTEVVSLLGPTAPKLTRPSGWEEISRPRQQAATNWTGQPLAKYSIEILLDGYRERRSVQREINLLDLMRLPTTGAPARISVTTAAAPVPWANNLIWVVEDLQHTDELIRENNVTYRQGIQLELLQFESPDAVIKERRSGRAKTRRTYRVKSGDTLLSIARSELGGGRHWRRLAEANKIRDPRKASKLKAGRVLRLP